MRRLQKTVGITALAAVLLAGIAWADRFVSPNGSNQAPYDNWGNAAHSIQTAINAASAGETIWVTNHTTYVLSAEIALNKAVTVRGFGGEPLPVINGNGTVRGFNISNSGAILDGLVISNGFHSSNGGGIYMTDGTVQNSVIITNRANSNGGGIYMTGGIVRDSDIAYNQVPTTSGDVRGGGIRLGNGTVTNCTIRFNYCERRYGGVALMHAGAKLLDSVLEGNRSRTFGGAGAGLEAAALIDGCTFTNNVSFVDNTETGGGGVFINTPGATVRNSFFYDNTAVRGGGIFMTAAGVVSNCVFIGNTGTPEGGAMLVNAGLVVNCEMRGNNAGASGGGGVMSRGTAGAILRNCLIASNTASGHAGGAMSINANGLILKNCTIVDNQRMGLQQWVAGAAFATNSIIYYNGTNPNFTDSIGYSCVPGLTGNGNISDPPQFVDRTNGDYRLLPTSPVIDQGFDPPQAWMVGGIDLDGNPRLAHGVWGMPGDPRVDMGAYEYQSLPPQGTLIFIR